MDSQSHIGLYRSSTLYLAPESPGIYAWYPMLDIGPMDWQMQVTQGIDQGRDNFRTLLREHTARFAAHPLSIQAESAFSLVWQGSIADVSNAALQQVLEPSDGGTPSGAAGGSEAAPKLQQAIDSPKLRESLVRILQATSPVFAAPVYIGVAINLRQRLEHHATVLAKLREIAINYPEKLEQALASPKLLNEFGLRAFRMGFTPDNLEVRTFDLSAYLNDLHDNEQLRVLAEAAEWLLNRWHRPLLGRR